MRIAKYAASSFPSFATQKLFISRKQVGVFNEHKANTPDLNVKRANLSVGKMERIKLPNYGDVGGGKEMYHISKFLSQPSGVEAILNTRALHSFVSLGSNMYRCTLPRVNFMNFDVAPVIDLQVTPTNDDCLVEMLSCRFEGSEVMERQNDHFSAYMKNHITWGTYRSESYLDVDVKLNLTLEIYTQPFNMLPVSAVETPGNLMMQAIVDRLVPLLLQQLLQDYETWVQGHREQLS